MVRTALTAPALDTAPWVVREPHVDPGALAVAESVFSLSNGFVGIRGTRTRFWPRSGGQAVGPSGGPAR